MFENTCAWCDAPLEEDSHEVMAYDDEGNEVGTELVCPHCIETLQYSWQYL